jgi:flagellar protein FlaH
MERISTGIKDLDELMEKGYPRDHTIFITGTTGSGKTILGLHYINQACKDGKKCFIIATEEDQEDLIAQAESLGLPLSQYFKDMRLDIDRVFETRTEFIKGIRANDVADIDELQSDIIGLLDRIPKDTEIVLIDNIGVFTLNMSVNEFRAQFDTLIRGLAKRKVSSVIIMDSASDDRMGGIAAYSVYGVLITSINVDPFTNKMGRIVRILKMRNTKIPIDPMRFDITSKGIVLLK